MDRSGQATPISYINRSKHFFADDIEDPNVKEAGEERLVMVEPVVRDDVSNMGRIKAGEEILYADR